MAARPTLMSLSTLNFLALMLTALLAFAPVSQADEIEVPDIIINEFMASNSEAYFDEDGDSSDWIELRNMSDVAIDISGWYLTDDAQDLRKWQFPSGMTPLPAGGYLVVFASDKNRRVAGSELHTNFKLSAGGEYLAVTNAAGLEAMHEYADKFPAQMEDISYGLGSSGVEVVLLSETAACEYQVPTSSATYANSNDWPTTGWVSGHFGIGYDSATTYQPYLDDEVAIDLATTMDNINATVLAKTTFTVDDPTSLSSLKLNMRFDDGFVAYLNGTEVASYYDPASLAWNSASTDSRSDSYCVEWTAFDLTSYIGLLNAGSNELELHGLNREVDSSDMLLQPQLLGVVDLGDALDYRYFETPTPGFANASGNLGFVAPVEADYPHGYYANPFLLTLVCDTEDAEIRYTTDCSVPTAGGATLYTGPISISQSTIIRAVAFKDGYDDAPSVTFSYIFPADVLAQGTDQTARGFPVQWYAGASSTSTYDRRTRTADYEMDPNITSDTRMMDALHDLPILSLVADMDDLFDSYTGIYPNSIMRASSNIMWEKPASLELFDPYGDGEDFTINAGTRISGELARWAAVNDKQSFRMVFKSQYGPSKLRTDFFDDPDIDEYDTILLRAHWGQSFLNDEVRGDQIGVSFANGDPTRTTYIRDIYGHDTFAATGQLAPRGHFAHLYLNGIYWGLYEVIERPDNSFNAEHISGSKDDYDVIKGGVGATSTNGFLQDGERSAYNQLFTWFNASSSGSNYTSVTPTSDTALAQIEEYLDVDNFIDYMITLWHTCRLDFPRKNWYCAARRDPNNPSGPPLERFRYYTWDSEASLWSVDSSTQADRWNATDTSNDTGPVRIYRRLRQNVNFQRRWADRVQELMFNDGPMTPANSYARFHARREEISLGVICESARWGDWAYLHHDDPMTRDNQWTTECNRIEDEYMQNRREYVLDQMAAVNLWPGFLAPEFNVHGGSVSEDFELVMTNHNDSGDIYYTLDGTDPRDGPSSLYSGPVSLAGLGFVEVNACVKIGGEWSAKNHAGFITFGSDGLVISEIMYNPPAGGEAGGSYNSEDYEYVELFNNTSGSINLAGMTLSGDISYTFPAVYIPAGERFIISANNFAMIERYSPAASSAHQFTGILGNGDGTVTLSGADGTVIFTVSYEDGGAWPGRADGTGSSLELDDELLEGPSEPSSWRNSAEYLGSPGWAGTGALNDIIVNEVLTHTDLPLVDYIELHNTTDSAINITGWYLSDSASTLKKYRIPSGTIPAGGYIVFDEYDFNSTGLDGNPANDDPLDFGLNSAHGDDVWLVEADASGDIIRFVEHAEFGAAANGVSLGKWPDGNLTGRFYPLSYPTSGLENVEPQVNDIVISEIAYNIEDDGDLEFVELFNAGNDDIDLVGGAIRGAIEFDFPSDTILESGERLIVISFNPDNPVNALRLAAFVSYYELDPEVMVLGGYDGNLNNAGERISLYSPDEPPLDEPFFTPLLLEDTVRYDDEDPWPLSADNGGDSLNRRLPATWADTVSAWVAAEPTPGEVSGFVQPGDANGDGRVNLDDFIVLKQNYGATSATLEMGDFNGDGSVNLDDFIILKQNYGAGAD